MNPPYHYVDGGIAISLILLIALLTAAVISLISKKGGKR
jgi:hypothetical protein